MTHNEMIAAVLTKLPAKVKDSVTIIQAIALSDISNGADAPPRGSPVIQFLAVVSAVCRKVELSQKEKDETIDALQEAGRMAIGEILSEARASELADELIDRVAAK